MSFNPLSLLFAPGLAVFGYLLGAAPGSMAALLSWAVLICMASAWVALRYSFAGPAH